MITTEQFHEMERRLAPKVAHHASTPKAVERERDLHDEIEADLKARRWYYVHSRFDQPTTTRLGVTDFIIAAPNGITFWIECKKNGGKLSEHQTVTKHVLNALGHRHFVVFNFQEYIAAISNRKEQKVLA